MLIFDGINVLKNGYSNQVVSLECLRVLLSPVLKVDVLNAVLIDKTGTSQMISLKRIGNKNKYNVFAPEENSIVELQEGLCDLFFVLINNDTRSSEQTVKAKLDLRFELYNQESKAKILAAANEDISNLYAKILDLTKLNIEASKGK